MKYQLNKDITLYHGDTLQILPTLSTQLAQLAINDPPYYKVVKDKWDHQWKTVQEYLQWSRKWMYALHYRLMPNASNYIFGSIGKKTDTIVHLKLLADQLWSFEDWITWGKSRGIGQRKGWLYTREELLWYVVNPKDYVWNVEHQYSTERRKRDKGMPEGTFRPGQNGLPPKSPFKRFTNVWTDISENGPDVLRKGPHSTPKPFKLIERIVLAHTKAGDLILDPFLGTGTTCEVAIAHGRKCIGIEQDKATFDETYERLRALL